MRRPLAVLILVLSLAAAALGQQVKLPAVDGSARLAVIGDSGTGDRNQYEVAKMIAAAHEQFPFELVLMLGDNMYGSEGADDFDEKFETPYKPLIAAGVKFYASLGNHDEPSQINYELFNMDGKRYYSFSEGPAQFFALDSTYMDPAQLDWLERELRLSQARWKIAFFHHPIYSSGARHGSEVDLRTLVEPLFVKSGVDVVFSGHEHFYERIHPQNGIYYFTSGAAGKLRRGNIQRGELTAAGYDSDLSFMLVEITDDQLHFQTISRRGWTVDSGVIERPPDPAGTETR